MIFRSKNSLVGYVFMGKLAKPEINVKSGLLGFNLGILKIIQNWNECLVLKLKRIVISIFC